MSALSTVAFISLPVWECCWRAGSYPACPLA
jgi:hypothetical protein